MTALRCSDDRDDGPDGTEALPPLAAGRICSHDAHERRLGVALVFRDPTIEQLARELADHIGDTLTAVVRRVLAASLTVSPGTDVVTRTSWCGTSCTSRTAAPIIASVSVPRRHRARTTGTVAEKLFALRAVEYFQEQAARANLEAATASLDEAGNDDPPRDGDELPFNVNPSRIGW